MNIDPERGGRSPSRPNWRSRPRTGYSLLCSELQSRLRSRSEGPSPASPGPSGSGGDGLRKEFFEQVLGGAEKAFGLFEQRAGADEFDRLVERDLRDRLAQRDGDERAQRAGFFGVVDRPQQARRGRLAPAPRRRSRSARAKRSRASGVASAWARVSRLTPSWQAAPSSAESVNCSAICSRPSGLRQGRVLAGVLGLRRRVGGAAGGEVDADQDQRGDDRSPISTCARGSRRSQLHPPREADRDQREQAEQRREAERGAEGVGGAAVELVLQFVAAAARPPARSSGSSGSGSKAGPIVGTLPFSSSSRSLDPLREVDLQQRLDLRVEDHRGAGVDRVVALLGDVGGEDRRQRQQADDDAGVAGGDRPAAVDRLRRAARRAPSRSAPRGPARGRPRPGSAAAPSARPSPSAAAPGRPRPPATRIAPAAARARALGTERPEPAAEERRERHHRDDDRGADRASAASLRSAAGRAGRAPRRSPPRPSPGRCWRATCGRPVSAQLALERSRSPPRAGRRRGSAPPRPAAPAAPGAGRSTARRRARSGGRRPPGPSAAPVAPAVGPERSPRALRADRRRQQLERRGDRGRAAERLHAAGGDQGAELAARRRRRGRRRRRPRARPRPPGPARPAAPASAAGTAASAITRLKETSTQVTPATLVSRSR